jgi:hypothetical protein
VDGWEGSSVARRNQQHAIGLTPSSLTGLQERTRRFRDFPYPFAAAHPSPNLTASPTINQLRRCTHQNLVVAARSLKSYLFC